MMGTLWDKSQSLAWWARHPQLYREGMRTAIRKLLPRSPTVAARAETEAARVWCSQQAIDTTAALRQVTGQEVDVDFQQRFASQLVEGSRRQAACPVKMGGGGNVELLYHLAEHVQAMHVIETGVAYGWSSLALLLSLTKRPGSRLISTDRPYPRTDSERWAGCVVADELRSNWLLIPNADREGLPRALHLLPQIDLCHYDSDKSPEGRQWAYPRLWQALRPGGVFVSDGVDDDPEFRRFCDELLLTPIIVRMLQSAGATKPEKFVGVLRKPASENGPVGRSA